MLDRLFEIDRGWRLIRTVFAQNLLERFAGVGVERGQHVEFTDDLPRRPGVSERVGGVVNPRDCCVRVGLELFG